jgi:hypothetical protein
MLENIGFYTLSNERCKYLSPSSRMWRCEMILTDRCNFKCPYCRGVRPDCAGVMPYDKALFVLEQWAEQGLKNIRFSGGEPLLYQHLPKLVTAAKMLGVERIAVSTNGSLPLEKYLTLIECGVNDFSISLDACCGSIGGLMAGVKDTWETVVGNIKELSKLTYVTVGIVLTETNVNSLADIVKFAHELGVADIRIISAAQYNSVLKGVQDIPTDILNAHPILKYRVNHLLKGRNVRGIQSTDCKQCYLPLDDSVVCGDYHFPCVIYMREHGNPIGKIGRDMRKERLRWCRQHNTHLDPICRANCLDVCIDHNNYCEVLNGLGIW